MANKIVGIDHAGHAASLRGAAAGRGFVGAAHAPTALNDHVVLGAGYFRRQGDLELHRRPHFQRGISADVNSGGAQVPGHATVLSTLIRPMDLDRQFHGEPFTRPCFGHKTSSLLAFPACKSQLHTAPLLEESTICLRAVISWMPPPAKA